MAMIATKRGLERETEESSSKPGEGRPGPRTSDAMATRATEAVGPVNSGDTL